MYVYMYMYMFIYIYIYIWIFFSSGKLYKVIGSAQKLAAAMANKKYTMKVVRGEIRPFFQIFHLYFYSIFWNKNLSSLLWRN